MWDGFWFLANRRAWEKLPEDMRAIVAKNIDAAAVKAQLDEATWQKLFLDVTPEDLATKGKPFPIAPYFNDILESYERKVQ